MKPRALVVGASSDIGGAIAVALADLDYSMMLWGRDVERTEAQAARCRDRGAEVDVDAVEVTDLVAVRAAVERVTAAGPLNAVVWVAGLFDWAPADQADPLVWQQLFDVNLTAAALLTPLVLPALIEAAPSALVYLGSGASHQAFANNAAYIASKHGLVGLARATFLDVRDRDVKVSLISPGLVAAGGGLFSPAGQANPDSLLAAEDVAAAVRFVVTFPSRGCPTGIRLQPQHTPAG